MYKFDRSTEGSILIPRRETQTLLDHVLSMGRKKHMEQHMYVFVKYQYM
jgi:hypothetical protein